MSVKIQTRLKGVPLEKFKRYMEKMGLSEYQAACDLIVRGLMDVERERAEQRTEGASQNVGAEVSEPRADDKEDWRQVFKPTPTVSTKRERR